jgi:MFS transporter, PAT family, beta-lactamase induction signal transducer AmpG
MIQEAPNSAPQICLNRGPHITMGDTSGVRVHGATGWRHSLTAYSDRRVLLIFPLGFASGLPFLLTFSTLSAWLATAGVRRAAIGAFALVATPYALKFLWSPLMDRLPPPLPLGRRRGWGVTIQVALVAAILGLGSCDPKHHLLLMAALALVVAFLSATQDIVIDAYRVEFLPLDLQGPGAGMIETGYRVAMLVSGAGTLVIAARAGWYAAYATMAALQAACMLVFLLSPEPSLAAEAAHLAKTGGREPLAQWFSKAVVGPFVDFMRRPIWPVILLFVFGYKLGVGMAAVMATPLYISLGFSLDQIAAVSKFVGFFSTVVGALVGGMVTVRFGILRSLMLCGILQLAGNLFYVVQSVEGHRVGYLALCVTVEQLTSSMAAAALIAYLSSLCSSAFTATQYALLSSLASLGHNVVASSSGALAEALGWAPFFALTSVASVPGLLLLVWVARRGTIASASAGTLTRADASSTAATLTDENVFSP